jgi:hypothetical protein
MQMSHRWEFGSVIHPHIHWKQTKSGNPNWLFQYRWQRNSGSFTDVWTSLECNTPIFTYVSGDIVQISDSPAVTPPTGYGISDILQWRVIRDVANDSGLFTGADTVTGDVSSISFDFHFEMDTLGSREEYVK